MRESWCLHKSWSICRCTRFDEFVVRYAGDRKVSVYVRVAIVTKRLKLSATLYEMLQILSLTRFERIPVDHLLAQAVHEDADHMSDKQLILFE